MDNKQKKNNLNKKTIEEIKEKLLQEKKQILEDLKDISEDDQVKFPDLGDKNDENAQEVSEYETNLVKDKVLESALKDIDSALERIEKGDYGICKYCHEEIGEKRLLARPVASACIDCKTKLQNS